MYFCLTVYHAKEYNSFLVKATYDMALLDCTNRIIVLKFVYRLFTVWWYSLYY